MCLLYGIIYGLSSCNRKMEIHHNEVFDRSITIQILTEITKDFPCKISKAAPQNRQYIGIEIAKFLYMTFHFWMAAKINVLGYTSWINIPFYHGIEYCYTSSYSIFQDSHHNDRIFWVGRDTKRSSRPSPKWKAWMGSEPSPSTSLALSSNQLNNMPWLSMKWILLG